ncbi:MAG TPA: DUF1648 domain-containing protein [Polyangiaceae bacterium]|jgi:uncharacterized membrane protein
MKLHPVLALFAAGPIAAILHEHAWVNRLPERVATHFGADGVPNGWMSRDDATTTYLALVIGLNLLFFLIALSLGALPSSMVNIPNRDYWLAPERRDDTVRKMAVRMAIFGVAVSTFLIVVFQMDFQAAVDAHPSLPMSAILPAMCVFFLFVVVWIGSLVVGFRKPA